METGQLWRAGSAELTNYELGIIDCVGGQDYEFC